ncbi:type IV pili methyl-accepting chemotaxis transducer N-terminal domain-containing protein [Methylophaga sp. OBS4]|uniref:type IV pili methyl-accepting chemotaxis transducer N-terminal domain-containing protein n=1 Tax=Methylophaga sp. OBS4 TaxID=2991935 RepID=UPI00225B06FE|nr:type IV pili methyl-accepting chemotaxis transducer N-terminal domain-containing protein [Methylophaga sp. OBS4]MCX4187530.1 type IV pili methyl-accepting chemotaxis transducer N-terminal domain-containing protein [Methylophaga sp. OBS4]
MLKLKIREKITGLLVFYFLCALIAIGSTLFVSWKLEGGAAAINDAGRERMRSYRIAYLLGQQVHYPSPELQQALAQEIIFFENTLVELQNGNPQRPLFIPEDPVIREQMILLRDAWYNTMKPGIQKILDSPAAKQKDTLLTDYRPMMENFVEEINELVSLMEKSSAHYTTKLRYIQIALMVVALLGSILLEYIFSLLLVRPVQRINQGLQSMGKADFSVRLPTLSNDELGEVARGFNQMAEKLQDIYTTLEQRVAQKTDSIKVKNRELGALYKVAAFLNSSTSAEPLCDSVLKQMMALTGARGGVVRLTDPKGEQLHVVAAQGVSKTFLENETYLSVGSCICGEVAQNGVAVSSDLKHSRLHTCNKENFRAVSAIPIRSNQRILGSLNLLFNMERILPPAEIRLLESVGLHLGVAIENQRLVAREREMAVSEERNLLAQELHDSIAQSLAFLNIQVQLLQNDLSNEKIPEALQVVDQIREGVQESYDDVRELLVHFRTRLKHADLEGAIASALEKFEGQVGIRTSFEHSGPTLDLPPEHALQILHILHESLSNIRKHSGASQVSVELRTEGQCSLTVKDNGKGFNIEEKNDDTHVGIYIMRERAHRFGGELAISSANNQGTVVSLSWRRPVTLTTEQRSTA